MCFISTNHVPCITNSAGTMLDDDKGTVSQNSFATNQVRVVTFDLDNTVWKTGPTIEAANDALALFLETKHIVQPQRVEVIMGELWERSKATYAPNNNINNNINKNAKSPVLLTQLRTDALEFLLLQHNGYTINNAKAMAKESFDVWTKARHEAIPSHLAHSVVETLQQIRLLVSSGGQPVLIGAITDGNSDPRNIPQLAEFFDFCINAEHVGVSKPDRTVYLAAVREAATRECVHDIFAPYQPNLTEDALEDIVGSWWVHIGDDFVKDIVAAKDLGMRSLWCRELIAKTIEEKPKETTPKPTVEDFVKKISDMKEITMIIGGGDYLASSLQKEFADSVIDSFADIHQVLENWHQEGLAKSVPAFTVLVQTLVEETPDTSVDTLQLSQLSTTNSKETTVNESKFCTFCGTRLPITARFCVSCGEKCQ